MASEALPDLALDYLSGSHLASLSSLPTMPGLFSVPGTHRAHSYLRAFVLAVPSAWDTLPSDMYVVCALFLYSLLRCHATGQLSPYSLGT